MRKLENLGEKELPYKMSAHKERFTHGRYNVHDIVHLSGLHPENGSRWI